jgi:hypothetical protein
MKAENAIQPKVSTKTKVSSKATTVFCTLTIVGVAMAAFFSRFQTGLDREIFIGIGSAMFGGALAFFLGQAFKDK